ncbi:MAG: hypothetical protein KatS3mg002_1235 [Candidatus Woesearchaeota archaeon]|nr:MAG: hypothetical protein KatS3mg002_1235 [Candidatus Woesearchaeota archaeon]
MLKQAQDFFYIDLTSPIVYLVSPNSTYLNNSNVYFSYQPIDNHLSFCALYGNFTGSFLSNSVK